ncbi:MAG: hypothetical protein QNJ97_28070 [Myxococcota bacterium]|nr:hypothetical protein [Myxococcota bacterium]
MGIIAVQYLEDSQNISPEDARKKLHTAFDTLPISKVIVGWNLAHGLVEACAEECARFDAELYRWQPLLTSDAVFVPKPEWLTIGLDREPVIHWGEPAFTFACPNHPDVRDRITARLQEIIEQEIYHGVFLDRIRFPSPMAAPMQELSCFCAHCRRVAQTQDLDLVAMERSISRLFHSPEQVFELVRLLLGGRPTGAHDETIGDLDAFLRFRIHSINGLVEAASAIIRDSSLAVGLDCFSPSLAHAVGQNIPALMPHADWTKIMSYGHTLGIAGLPYELSGLAAWMIGYLGLSEARVYRFLSDLTGLFLPSTTTELCETGIPSAGLAHEAAVAPTDNLYAGIELVDLDRFTVLNDAQITSDMRAFKSSGVAGLLLSWDLWHIPQHRLDLVRKIWVDG